MVLLTRPTARHKSDRSGPETLLNGSSVGAAVVNSLHTPISLGATSVCPTLLGQPEAKARHVDQVSPLYDGLFYFF
nr:hypothetical protein Itr_chr09CG16500 [Ipomoea trifida]